ncbi:MAG: hypothetical protein A4E71_02866 [Smithella sp. PtaU1.Bin162]|nr:MAG: hypothetical protein A4E71_02866 [Smithella sp. PtaU1.Bin162]
MLATERIDPINSVEILFNEIFQHVFQNNHAREYLGYSQISQTFSAEGFPGWYLWFNDIKGAYCIETTGESVHPVNKDSMNFMQCDAVRMVQFVLRYFPTPDEKNYNYFSRAEQIFRKGSDFDATGTPTFEGKRNMPDVFYAVGHVTISLDQSSNVIDFSCRAADSCKNYKTDSLALSDNAGVKTREISRNRDVEGWNLSRHIFDKIISAYIFMTHQQPAFISAAACPLNEYPIDDSGNVRAIKNAQFMKLLLLVSFRKSDDLHATETTLRSQSKNFIGLWNDSTVIPAQWNNSLWWSINDHHFHDNDCCLCSCYSEQH